MLGEVACFQFWGHARIFSCLSTDSVLFLCQEQEKRITPIIVYPAQKTTSAALGKAQHDFWKHLVREKLEQVLLRCNLLA